LCIDSINSTYEVGCLPLELMQQDSEGSVLRCRYCKKSFTTPEHLRDHENEWCEYAVPAVLPHRPLSRGQRPGWLPSRPWAYLYIISMPHAIMEHRRSYRYRVVDVAADATLDFGPGERIVAKEPLFGKTDDARIIAAFEMRREKELFRIRRHRTSE